MQIRQVPAGKAKRSNAKFTRVVRRVRNGSVSKSVWSGNQRHRGDWCCVGRKRQFLLLLRLRCLTHSFVLKPNQICIGKALAAGRKGFVAIDVLLRLIAKQTLGCQLLQLHHGRRKEGGRGALAYPWILKFDIFRLPFEEKGLIPWFREGKLKFQHFCRPPGKNV